MNVLRWQSKVYMMFATVVFLLTSATSGMAAPPAPTLSYPADGASSIQTNLSIPFAWYGTGTNYRIVISQNLEFSGFSDANGSSSCTNDTCFTATTSSTKYSKAVSCKGQKYYWKVRANDSTGASAFSTTRSFMTSGAPSCTLATKVDAFVNKYKNKTIGSGECVALMRQYAKDVIGLSDGGYAELPTVALAAYSIFDLYQGRLFNKVYNSATAVPQKGDIVFWNKHSANGYYGHVAIFISGDINNFESFDQNWNGRYAHRVSHNYTSAGGVVGWLHPNL